MKELEGRGISTRPGTHAVHLLNYYRSKFDLKPNDLPGAHFCHEYSMAIPLHNKMTAEDYKYVVESLKSI
jgi:dTDP-4-amino-4,6-dideoxygalactose transaminase